MFEIPDEDDAFWEELPLDDVTNLKSSDKQNDAGVKLGEKRLSGESHTENGNARKKIRLGLNEEAVQDNQRFGKERQDYLISDIQSTGSFSLQDFSSTRTENVSSGINNLVDPEQRLSSYNAPTECGSKGVAPVNNAGLNVNQNSPQKSTAHRNKTRRKFPGPAGLLPRLSHGRFPEAVEESPIGRKSTSPEVVKDNVILSSQSGEEAFSCTTWKSLIADLGEDSEMLLRKFSVASYLHKARKKQLPSGKVPLLMCVIETVDRQGCDASVCLKDTTGRIQGTIHRDVIKDYDTDLQPGAVIVLRQVGVISPTSRNHYLNITPSNIVIIYTQKDSGLSIVNKYDQGKSLGQIFKELEKDLDNNSPQNQRFRSMMTPRTPNSEQTVPHALYSSTTPKLTQNTHNPPRGLTTPNSVQSNRQLSHQSAVQNSTCFINNAQHNVTNQNSTQFINNTQHNVTNQNSTPNICHQPYNSTSMHSSQRPSSSHSGVVPQCGGSTPRHQSGGSVRGHSAAIPSRNNISGQCAFTPSPNTAVFTSSWNMSNNSSYSNTNNASLRFRSPNPNSDKSIQMPNNQDYSKSKVENLFSNRQEIDRLSNNKSDQNVSRHSVALNSGIDTRMNNNLEYVSQETRDKSESIMSRKLISVPEKRPGDLCDKEGRGNMFKYDADRDVCSSEKKGYRFKMVSKTPDCGERNVSACSVNTNTSHITKHVPSHSISALPIHQKKPPSYEVDTLWQDDLSDEMLSQLSEEMI